jgi:hypothetical protein
MAFFVATPALLFTVLSHADVSVLFSEFLVAIVCTIVVGVFIYLVLARLFFRTPLAETVLGASSATYVNANNIGLPVAIYVLGSAQYVAPVLLLQLVILAPAILAVLDMATRGRASFVSIVTQPFRNPMILGSLAGVLVATFDITLPAPLLAPFDLIGGAAIPLVLLSFGMSLHGQRLLKAGTGRKQVVAATLIKVVLMPTIAFLFGHFVFDLDGAELFAVVAVSALPTAQNIFNFASRYDRAMVVTRDTVLLTTILSMPALLVIAALLA